MDIQQLLDRAAIFDVLVRYCRGVDRRDLATLKGVYWSDATDDHGIFSGNGHEFAELNVGGIGRIMSVTQHFVTNAHYVIQGDQAEVESYVLAYHRVFDSDETVHDVLGAVYAERHASGSNEGHDFLAGGQWFDRFERRDGVWRIINRIATTHWDMVQPSSSVGREGMFKAVRSMGPPDRAMPS